MKHKITKRSVDSLSPPSSGVSILHDSEIAGFHVRAYPSGRRSYFLHYRHRGQERRPKIGDHGAITPDEARRTALSWKGMIARGEDPHELKKSLGEAICMDDLYTRFQTWAAARHKPRTIEQNDFLYRTAIGPVLGRRPLAELSRSEIERFHTSLKATPTKANQSLTLLRTLLNKAIHWELAERQDNPSNGISKFTEGRHERFLSVDEVSKLHVSLNHFEEAELAPLPAIAAIRLLLYTGCRRGEILDLTWDEVDLPRQQLVLRDSKTGRKRIYLNDEAAEVIASLQPNARDTYVISGKLEGKPLQGLEKIWQRVRKHAGLSDVRLHDLRHSFASFAISEGLSLSEVGAALGHKDIRTTQRYAHLSEMQVRRAVMKVGKVTSARPWK